MKNPLTSMSLALDTLSEKPDLEPYHKKLDSLRNNTRRLSELIADLLDLYKSETGMMSFASEEFSAAEVCTDAIHSIDDAAHALRVEIVTPPDLGGLAVLGDKKATTRILTNLMSNAVKHSPADSKVELTVAPNAEKGTIDFSVIDHGPGIPEHERASIFNRFQQGSTAQQSRLPGLGTGLGLAICKTFAERQHGDVQLTASTVGGGSTFTLRLPRAQG
jgi:signal transduction histidine kinase